jgi:hypothetical protein
MTDAVNTILAGQTAPSVPSHGEPLGQEPSGSVRPGNVRHHAHEVTLVLADEVEATTRSRMLRHEDHR